MTTDPVCGMTVEEKSAAGNAMYAGKAYYFCYTKCHGKFVADPVRYVGAATKAAAPAADSGGIYTCPMHPDIRQPGLGVCPNCGMALEPAGAPAQSSRTGYVCPMHPQIVRDAPGECPICGMALEPRTVTLEEEESLELVDMTHRFWVSTMLAVPVFVSAMAADFWPETMMLFIRPHLRQWLELIVATPAVIWGGWIFTCARGARW